MSWAQSNRVVHNTAISYKFLKFNLQQHNQQMFQTCFILNLITQIELWTYPAEAEDIPARPWQNSQSCCSGARGPASESWSYWSHCLELELGLVHCYCHQRTSLSWQFCWRSIPTLLRASSDKISAWRSSSRYLLLLPALLVTWFWTAGTNTCSWWTCLQLRHQTCSWKGLCKLT